MPLNASVISVAVTGLNSTDSPAPGIPVMRSIKEAARNKVNGIGLGYDSLDAGLYRKSNFNHVYLLPYPSEGADCLMDRLLKIHSKTPMDVLIPTLDAEIFNIITIQKRLQQMGIHTLIPTREQLQISSKPHLSELGKKANIATIPGKVLGDTKNLSRKVEEIGFPLMVKGVFYEAYKAQDMDDVNKYISKLAEKWGMPIILQKYIEGEEFNVTAVGNREGKLRGMVSMRKLLTTDKGKGWAGVTIKDPEIDRLVEQFFEATHWCGPLELEILKTKEPKKFYLIEVNPRFPAWVYLSKAAGVNLPWLTCRLALGWETHSKPIKDYELGVIFTRYANEDILHVKELETLNVEGELHYA